MEIARSTVFDEPASAHDDTAIVEAIAAVCDEFEAYGWRRFAPSCGIEARSSITRRSAG